MHNIPMPAAAGSGQRMYMHSHELVEVGEQRRKALCSPLALHPPQFNQKFVHEQPVESGWEVGSGGSLAWPPVLALALLRPAPAVSCYWTLFLFLF